VRTIAKILVHRIGALAVALLAGGLLTAILVRVSPGFDSDERQLDPRLNQASRMAIEQERGANRNILGYYARRLERIGLHGDLGRSASLNRPIASLLRERIPVTAQIMAIGVVGGWALAFALAVPAAVCRSLFFRGLAGLSQQVLMCLPAAALAILVFGIGGPVRGLVALVVCPRVFEYLRNLLVEAYGQSHIVTARAKGLGGAAIFARHVMPYVAPQLFALAGVSVGIAFGAAIPIEALCDLPGLGQLAWLAATARDLPLLLVITFLVIATTQICNAAADWAALRRRPV
jgi:peptide/nickel transport system permease protein